MKTFIREIPIERLTDQELKKYEDRDYKIEWKAESIEIWYIPEMEKAA